MTSGRTSRVLGIMLVLVLGVGAAAQQPALPTFRAETNLIEVDAVVTDTRGNVIRGLTQDDFTILEDGKPRPVSGIDQVSPAQLAHPRPG